ncbi:type II toxin-antitoxin system YafQ family toxin [Candidatus Bipolaricaulota bacterium]|nr:type II toxin-antitoxin system YafQ family toxin [Candidatus Bipolaricaulota bacterium]
MLSPVYTTQFSKDIKRLKRRKKDFEKLKLIVRTLLRGETLDPLHHDHKLIGDFQGRHECHIEADWLLIYKTTKRKVIFERTGTHADLFE